MDITEHKIFRNRLFESSALPIIVMDSITYHYIDCNPAAVTIYGFASVEETLGKTPLDVSAPVQYDGVPSSVKVRHFIDRALTEGFVVFEWCHQQPDGTQWDAEVHLMRFTSVQAILLQFTLIDITERKRLEEELRKSEERYRAVVENQTELICRWLSDGTLTFVNEAYCRYFAKQHEELVGKSFSPLIPEEDHNALKEHISLLTSSNPSGTIEHRVIAPNGELRWMQWNNSAILGLEGQIMGFQSVGRDITERKQMDEELRNHRKNLERLVQERTSELETKAIRLGETNIALKVLLEQRAKDKGELEDSIMFNVHKLVAPYIDKLINSPLNPREAAYVRVIDLSLRDITSPFANKLSSKFLNLTLKEIDVVNMVKEGKSTKEIAGLLNSTVRTVEFHRNNIRQKLGLIKGKKNLRTYLLSLS